jgi:hypothetical protein
MGGFMENKEAIRYEDICFVYYAMPGAQGEEDVGCIVTKGDNGAIWHRFNTDSEEGWAAFVEAFPPLKEYGIDCLYEPVEPWRGLPLSAGHLLISNEHYSPLYVQHFQRYKRNAKLRRQANPSAPIPQFNWIKLINSLLRPLEKQSNG